MIPRTLSASSMQVAALCMDRWKAEYMDRVPGPNNFAANIGTTVHGALEAFVKAFFINKTHDPRTMTRAKQQEMLVTFYNASYIQVFGNADFDTDEYKDGYDLTIRWFKRNNLVEKPMIGVETVEVKETIKVPYDHPEGISHTCPKCVDAGYGQGVCLVDFNYLMDRVDQLEETVWEVVDYKTVRVPIQPNELEVKLQARAYALAIQIKHPNATRIKVTFDLLRHEPVSIWVTKEDNIRFWNFLCTETQRIVDLDENDVRPVLNAECGFCVKKYSCELMTKNIAGGGVHSLSPDEAAAMIVKLKEQIKANNRIVDDLEEKVMRHAAHSEQLEWRTEDGGLDIEITASRRRTFDAKEAAEIMGPELFAQMGNMTLGNLEKITKDESLDADMRARLKALIGFTNGNLGVKINPVKSLY